MQRVIDFIYQNELQYFSTIGIDNKPKVRPFQMIFNEGGKFIYCTGSQKEVYQELLANPCVELCVATSNKWLRIQAEVCWIDDIAIKEKIISSHELVASIYLNATNPELKAFYLSNATAVFKDFSGNAPEIINLFK